MNRKSSSKKSTLKSKKDTENEVSGLSVNEAGKVSFPVSWIQKQQYCEYQIYLEHFRHIKAKPTIEMIIGSREHHRLETEFKETAEPATVEEMIEMSVQMEVYSREFPVKSLDFGIHGLIDEIQMSPESFLIIDDKPGQKTYSSNIFQVYAYCLAFKEMLGDKLMERKIFAGLRERGTDNIYWVNPFDEQAENEIVSVVTGIHGLISGNKEFQSTNNPNKCNKCRFKNFCDRKPF